MIEDILTRAAPFEPSTFDAAKRTVQVVFSTGADVTRADYEGQYIERLSMDPGAVDLSKLIGGPVLDNHDRFSGVRSILGVVETASVDGKRGVANLRFSERPEVQGVLADVKSGVIRSVSAGYSVQKWEVSKRADGARIKTATRWAPVEVSFTPLAADAGAQTRGKTMIEQLQTQIRSLVELSGLPATFGEDLITRNVATIEEARTAVFTEAASRTPVIQHQAPAVETRNGGDQLVTRLADGLLSRMNPAHTPEAGRAFAYHRVADIARECLQARGLSTLGSQSELLTRAMYVAGDFPAVLGEVFNKSLLSLRAAQPAITQIFRRTTIADFRARHVLEISDGPTLLKMGEGAQLTYGAITDKDLASYSLDSYARGFSISFKALVNDDVQALADLSTKMTNGARNWFAQFLTATLISNPKLTDTVDCFHANHNNLAGAGAAPSDTTVAAGKLAMRKQKDASGAPIEAAPKYIVIPAAHETTVDKLLATIYPTSSTGAETAIRSLTPLVVPQLDAAGSTTAWWLFCDPSEAPVFEYAELSGQEGPRVEVRQGFDTLGTELRVVWHVGAGAIDSRGAYRNAGV